MGKGFACFGGFVLGATVGAAIGMLYAPRPGAETRAMVSERIDDCWNEGQEVYNRSAEKVQATYESAATRVRNTYNTASEKVGEAASSVKPTIEEKNDELRTKIDEARDRIAAEVNKNAASAHDAISEKIPVAASKVDEAVEAAQEAARKAAEKIAPGAASDEGAGA